MFVPVRDAAIVVIPDRRKLEGLLHLVYTVMAPTLAAAFGTALLIARLGARETLRALVTVTAELERFAAGDFAPRALKTDGTEFGALAAAYNGAANNVTAAFLERRRVEDQIRLFVAGYVDVLRRGAYDDPAIRHAAFASLTVEIKRMRTLVERLMTLARLDRMLETDPEVVDVVAIVEQAVNAFGIIAESPITLTASRDVLILGEPVDLYEAVANLIENALKYGARTRVAVSVTVDNEAVHVRVRDGGPGISETDRSSIFERFYRGAERGEIAGSGLGLAIPRKLLSVFVEASFSKTDVPVRRHFR